jgi:hypothetical protein
MEDGFNSIQDLSFVTEGLTSIDTGLSVNTINPFSDWANLPPCGCKLAGVISEPDPDIK